MAVTKAAHPGRYQTRALGTRADLLTVDPDAIDAATGVMLSGLAWIDRVASRFRDDSDLTRLNAAGGRPFPAGADLFDALAVAVRAARLTDGLVTPLVGQALCATGYDRDFAAMDLTQNGRLPVAAPVPPWSDLQMDPTTTMVRVPAGAQVDLSATAKAWAADRIAARASQAAGCGVLVSLGGDMAVAGPAPTGGWSVGLADVCEADVAGADATVSLDRGGLATSGVAARSWQRDNRTVHHLIDPATGLPAESCWRSVSVAAATCVDANIAATAAVILGARAPAWLTERALPARLVRASGDVVVVCGWPGPEPGT